MPSWPKECTNYYTVYEGKHSPHLLSDESDESDESVSTMTRRFDRLPTAGATDGESAVGQRHALHGKMFGRGGGVEGERGGESAATRSGGGRGEAAESGGSEGRRSREREVDGGWRASKGRGGGEEREGKWKGVMRSTPLKTYTRE